MPSTSLLTKPVAAVAPRVLRLVDTRIETKAKLEVLKKEIEELDAKILAEAERAGGTIECDDWKVTKVDGENRYIKKELLLTLGVKASVIAKATSVTEYAYAKITVKKNVKG